MAVSGDGKAYPESASAYGVWDVPKTYIHLYEENPIVMDWDQPMENFDGKTPYEVSRDLGFVCHGSQYENWARFFSADKASGLPTYSPCQYGLYRTTVGADRNKNDMFENVLNHAELDRLEQEEAARAEAERAEEQKRLAEEQRALEESIADEHRRRETARKAMENRRKMEPLATAAWIVGGIILLIILVFALVNNRRLPVEYDGDEP